MFRDSLLDILHNDLPSGHIRSAVVASESIDVHVAVSEKIARSLAGHGVPPERIKTIPNGVDTEGWFRPDRYERLAARNALRLVEDRPVLAWVGRLSEEKRPIQFVEIVSSLCERFPVTGMIVGDGPLAPQVDAAIDRVRQKGLAIRRVAHLPREEMASVYVAADLLVMTSSIEGLPFVALEALACGCPVAATDVGDLRTIIRHGEMGFFVPADKPDALVEHLASALRDRASLEWMRKQARGEIAASRFTKTKMLGAYRELFSQLLGMPESDTASHTA